MAYKPASLTCLVPRLGSADNLVGDDGGRGVALWAYRGLTAEDDLAAMQTDDFIDDANDTGIQVGDIVIFVEDTVDASFGFVDTISAAGLVTTLIVSNP